MTDRVEELVRADAEGPVGALGIGALRARVARHRRARVVTRVLSIAVVLALAGGVVWLATSGGGATRHEVTAPAPAGSPLGWHGLPLLNALTVTQIASNQLGSIAIGAARDPLNQTEAVIWTSADGKTWQVGLEIPEPSPSPANVRPTEFDGALAMADGFVVWGSHGVPGIEGPVADVWLVGPGRFQEVNDPSFAPPDVHPAPPPVSGGPGSAIYGMTEYDGGLLAVGEIRTGSKAPDRGVPAVWTSRGGATWQRHRVDLGPGFDPQITSVAARDGLVVVAGRVGKFPANVWTTRDLRQWRKVTLAPQGGVRVVATPKGFVAQGAEVVRQTKNGSIVRPLVWRSTDGRHWRRVLRLAPGNFPSGGQLVANGSTLVYFGQSVTGPARHPVTRPFVYESTDAGRTWREGDPDHSTFAVSTRFVGGGSMGADVVLAGVVENSPIPGVVLWRSAPPATSR